MTEKALNTDALSPTDLLESYKPDLDDVWSDVLQPTKKPLSTSAPDTREARKRRILDNAINVTKARNVAGLGRIVQSAQEEVRVVCNQKTSEVAYVIGPELMEEILEMQVHSLQEKIEEIQAELEARTEAALVAESRRSFFNLSNSFKPIDADVPVVEGTPPSQAIEF